jgi:O-antigen/teichoic acid export membrane protein
MTTPEDPATPAPAEVAATDPLPLADGVVGDEATPLVPDVPPAPVSAGVSRAAATNAAWTMVGYVLMQVIRLGSTVILSRLLFPKIFGLMTLVNVFIQGIQMFTDIGIGPSLIQSKRGDDDNFRNTAWTIMVGRGFVLWLAAALIAWPVSLLVEPTEPSIAALLPVVGVAAAINGFESTAIYTLRRRLLRARLVLLEVGTYFVTMALTILWVYFQPTVWALIVSNIFSTSVQMLVSHFLIPGYRNRFRWDPSAVHELVHFGKWVFVSTLCTFLANQMDKLIVGMQSISDLGVYNFAVQLALLPITLMVTLGWQLIFPLYSRLHQAGRPLQGAVTRVHPLVAGFGAFLVAGLFGAGPTVVRCLYDYRYEGASWMVQLLAVGAWFQMLEVLESSVLWTVGQTRTPAVSNMSKLVAMAVLVPLGVRLDGFRGMLAGFVLADAVRYLWTLLAVKRLGLSVLRYDGLLSLLILLSGVPAFLLGEWLWPLLAAVDLPAGEPPPKDWGLLLRRGGTEAGVVVGFWAVVAVVCWKRGLLRRTWDAPEKAP